MENPRKLDGRYTTVNDRLQRMRNLCAESGKNDPDQVSLSDRGVTRDINRLRQRKSAKYALEWLERIRPDFRLESSEMEKLKEHQNYFPEVQTLRGNLSKVDMQDCSAKNYGKYRENLRGSRKMRSEINDSFLGYWNPSQAVEAGKLANETRHLVPAKKGKIFRYKQERIELLSVDEMVTPERSDPNNQHRKNSLDLCSHPLLHPFLAKQTDGQKAITVDEVSGEAVVIYRRKERRQSQDWKNYQTEQFTFGKTNLSLDTKKKRSSSEPRETSPQKQACVTRRRRSKFHYEPVKLDRSVSIEFKKFDEIQEVLHPKKTVPCQKYDNARVWKSNEFRLRSSAKMKLNLFKEMKKKERYRQKKFEETVARSLNCGLYENFNRRSLSEGDEKAKDVVPEEDSPKVPSSESPAQAGASPEERLDDKTLGMPTEKRSNHEWDTKSLSQEALERSAISELGKVSVELAAAELIGSTEPVSGDLQEGNSRSVTNATFDLGTNVSNPGEIESLTSHVENVLQDSSHELHLDSSIVEETFKPLQDCFREEGSLVIQAMPVLLYPSSVRSRGIAENFTGYKSGSAQKLRDSSLREPELRKLMVGRQKNKTMTLGSGKLFTSKSESSDFHKRLEPRECSTSKESLTSSELENAKWHRRKYGKTLSTTARSGSSSLISGRRKLKFPSPSTKNHAKSFRSTPSDPRDTEPVANKSTRVVEKRIARLEGKLKELLRRIGICPIREQETIKNCLERLKETSEAALRRLTRIEYCKGGSLRCPVDEECSVDIYREASSATARGYSSEPDSAVKVDKERKSIIIKTSESEIQLKVGMEITMENFDPVTGEKLNPETNREFEQQGNISCKLLKPGEKPVTFIDTDFLYNPKTGMLFKGNQQSMKKIENADVPLKTTKTYLLSKTIESQSRSYPEEKYYTEKDTLFTELYSRSCPPENVRSSSDSRLRGTSQGTSKSGYSDPFRMAVEREEIRNSRIHRAAKKGTRSLSDTKKTTRCTRTPRSDVHGQDRVTFADERRTDQAYYFAAGVSERETKSPSGRTKILAEKATQANLGVNAEDQWESRRKSTGIQAELKTGGKILANKAADTSTAPSVLRKGTNASAQTVSAERFLDGTDASDGRSQADILREETEKYLKDLETQKRVNLAIAELCYHLSNNCETRGKG